mmetsp:Transcript_19994/g.62873  ORF Transcript_19994/g.62873 Transcript_19994/m.62873 type:complete len:222 (+) Transcript_19994:481-1146(+)
MMRSFAGSSPTMPTSSSDSLTTFVSTSARTTSAPREAPPLQYSASAMVAASICCSNPKMVRRDVSSLRRGRHPRSASSPRSSPSLPSDAWEPPHGLSLPWPQLSLTPGRPKSASMPTLTSPGRTSFTIPLALNADPLPSKPSRNRQPPIPSSLHRHRVSFCERPAEAAISPAAHQRFPPLRQPSRPYPEDDTPPSSRRWLAQPRRTGRPLETSPQQSYSTR